MTPAAVVEDLLPVDVPLGGRVLVISDLHLGPVATPTSSIATNELAQAIEAWTGPGLLVFNGSCLELLGDGGGGGPAAALAAHPRLTAVVKAFAEAPGRRVLYLPGARDGRVAWDAKAAGVLRSALGADITLAAELIIDTGAGPRRVRVEPGHRLDPLTRLDDPCNPAESPLGHHLMCEVLPALHESASPPAPPARGREGWLSGLDSLDDPASFPRFLASRLTYRRLGRYAWVLALPLVAAVLLRLPFAVVRQAHQPRGLGSAGWRCSSCPGDGARAAARRHRGGAAGAGHLAGAGRRGPGPGRRGRLARPQRRRPGAGPGADHRGPRRADHRPYPPPGAGVSGRRLLRQHGLRRRGGLGVAGPVGGVRGAVVVPGAPPGGVGRDRGGQRAARPAAPRPPRPAGRHRARAAPDPAQGAGTRPRRVGAAV